jgi:hypothetical protein
MTIWLAADDCGHRVLTVTRKAAAAPRSSCPPATAAALDAQPSDAEAEAQLGQPM